MTELVLAARRRVPRLPLFMWVAIAAVLAFSAGALYWNNGRQSEPSGHWLTRQGAVAEYRREARGLELAPGWSWPAKLPFLRRGPDGAPMRYESGFGAGQASIFWFCSWASTAVAPSQAPAARRRAILELPRVHRTPLFTRGLLHDPSYYDEMIGKTNAGDTSQLVEYVRANCPAKH